jgi:LPS-assembly lipoprotein
MARFCRVHALRAAAGLALVVLAACGFQLRGETPLPFHTLYLGVQPNSKFGANLRRAVRAASPDTRLVDKPTEAEVIMQQVENRRSVTNTSLNAQGQVEEYELSVHFTFRLIDSKGNAILPDTSFTAYREMPYNNEAAQALTAEMESLYVAMEQSLTNRVVRRMTAADVRENYDKLIHNQPNPNMPVFDPSKATPEKAMPPAWTNPANYLNSPPK